MSAEVTYMNVHVNPRRRPSTFHVETNNFTAEDLELFTESVEILSRLEVERHQRKLLKKAAKRNIRKSQKAVNQEFHNSLIIPREVSQLNSSAAEALFVEENLIEEPSLPLEYTAITPKSFNSTINKNFKECYISTPSSSNQSTPQKHTAKWKSEPQLQSSDSTSLTSVTSVTSITSLSTLDSTESGVFDMSKYVTFKTLPSTKMANNNSTYSYSPLTFKVQSRFKRFSMRSVNYEEKSSVKLLACLSLGELDTLPIYENCNRTEKICNFETMKSINWFDSLRKKSRPGVVYTVTESAKEQGFLTKAMSYLTL